MHTVSNKCLVNAIDACKDIYLFKDCWSLGAGFEELKYFAGGIATVMLVNSLVKADFSLE